MRPILWLTLALAALGACSGSAASSPDAGLPPRTLEADLTVEASGFSEELTFDVPSSTRSLTVVVNGAPSALYALGALRTADGTEHVGLDVASPPGSAMQESYVDEQIGHMAGGLYQSVRLGTFTHIFPERPGQALPAGTTTLRVASDTPGPVHVTVLLPPEDGASVLHLNLVAVSDDFTFMTPPSLADEVQAIFAQVGVTIVFDSIVALPGTGLSSLTDFTEPQETPTSMSAMLPALVAGQVSAPALDVFVVDSLPAGVGGLSLGTPGPPLRGSYYYGVVLLKYADDTAQARVLAHEVAHFLALQHVENRGVSGTVYPDPLADTQPGQGNLMENGTTLTADQAFAISRSALLQLL